MFRIKRSPSAIFYLAHMGDVSKMDPQEIAQIHRKCIFDDFHRVMVTPERPNIFYKNGVICFREQLRYRLRFPLCPELITIFCYYNIVPAQIFPASLGQIMVVINFLRKRRLRWSIMLFCHLFEYFINGHGIFRFFSNLTFLNLPGQSLDWLSKYFLITKESPWHIKTNPRDDYPVMYLRDPRRMNIEERDSYYHLEEFPLDFNELVSWADCCEIGMTYRDFHAPYPSPIDLSDGESPVEKEFCSYEDYLKVEYIPAETSTRLTININDQSSPAFAINPENDTDYFDTPTDPAGSHDRCVRFNKNRTEVRINRRIDPLDTDCLEDTCTFDFEPVVNSQSLEERMKSYPPGSIPYEVACQNLSAWQHNHLMATTYFDLTDKFRYLQGFFKLVKGEKDALLDEIVKLKVAATASQRELDEKQCWIEALEGEMVATRREVDEGVEAVNIFLESKDEEIGALKEKMKDMMTFSEFAQKMKESPENLSYLKEIRVTSIQECLDKLANEDVLGEEFRNISFYAEVVDKSDSASDAGSRDT